MHIQHAIDAYLTAVAQAQACVDAVHAQVGASKRPSMSLTIGGTRKGSRVEVQLATRALSEPGHTKTASAHATLAHRCARLVWDGGKHARADAVRDAGVALLALMMRGPQAAHHAVLHTSIAPGLALAHVSLDHPMELEPAHALDLARHRAAFTALVHASQDPLGGAHSPSWCVTTFLHPLPHAPDRDDPALCVERIVQAGTVEQAFMATALTGVNTLLAGDRLENAHVWKSLEGHDAQAFHAFLADHRTTSPA